MAVHLHLLLLQIIILLVWAIKATKIQCPTSCGDVSDIRYPFGIGENCYFNEWFEVTCDNSSGSPVPFFRRTNLKLSGIARQSNGIVVGLSAYVNKLQAQNLSGTPFYFSHKRNKFMATGCNNYRHQINSTTRCLPICTCDPAKDKSCYDFMCTVSPSHQVSPDIKVPQNCTGAVMVEQDWLVTNYLANTNPNPNVLKESFPVVMEFGRYKGNCAEPFNYKSRKTSCNKDGFCLTQLKSGHLCVCSQPKENRNESGCRGNLFCNITSGKDCSICPRGYKSNFSQNGDDKPMCYPPEAYKQKSPKKERKKNITIGLNSVFGTLSLSIGAQLLYKFFLANKLKQIFFKKNVRLLIQQHMSSNDGNIQKLKFFTENELEKATDSYNQTRILGQGGQGTVYKGMLEEGKIIAVKRLKKAAERVDVFIKELEILSQINHRNVVQFLGCCLETEFPLLAYEFIPNGTLFQYIHDQNEEFPLTWDLRLRIAINVADALSYLHSVASIRMYHRDIKSSNILLDEKYRAKVSDVGTSRSVPGDQTHLTTRGIGPRQFTEKMDVYNFGVVLAELLTGQEPVRSINLEEIEQEPIRSTNLEETGQESVRSTNLEETGEELVRSTNLETGQEHIRSTNLEEEDRSLALYFLRKMKDNRLFEILDARVSKDGREQEIMAFANLTTRCLKLNWRKRPTMREVATELAGIRTSNGDSILKQICKETDDVDGDKNSRLGTSSSFTRSFFE